MLLDTGKKDPYRNITNLFEETAKEQNAKQDRHEKLFKILFVVMWVGMTVLLMIGVHVLGVIRNGYEGIGSEVIIPIGSFALYLTYKELQNSEKRRQKRYEEYAARVQELRRSDTEF